MTIGAKILAALAALCFLAWALAFALGVQPLMRAAGVDVIYGVHEDFLDDGMAFRKFRNTALVVVHLPKAPPDRQWWTVDFENLAITGVSPPHSLGRSFYVIKGDLEGNAIAGDGTPGAWLWHFSGDSASFASRSFTCRVRRTDSK